MPANTEAARRAVLNGPVGLGETPAAVKAKPLAGLALPGFFPADMTNLGGVVIGSGSSEDIYYNCPNNDESCWGDPEGFLFNLSNSKFIHVTDQYVGLKANKRYPPPDRPGAMSRYEPCAPDPCCVAVGGRWQD